MKRQASLVSLFVALLWVMLARADTAIVVRTTNLPALQALCQLPAACVFFGPLDGPLRQLLLATKPLSLQTLLGLLNNVPAFLGVPNGQVRIHIPNAGNPEHGMATSQSAEHSTPTPSSNQPDSP